MDERAYAVFVVEETWFTLLIYGDGFPFHTAKTLVEDPPSIIGDAAIAKFLRSGLSEGAYDLAPMPRSTYTHAYFWRDDSGGITVIKGRYW